MSVRLRVEERKIEFVKGWKSGKIRESVGVGEWRSGGVEEWNIIACVNLTVVSLFLSFPFSLVTLR